MSDSMSMTVGTSDTATINMTAVSHEPEQPHYTLPYYATEVDEVHESVQRAIELVQFFSEQAEHTDGALNTTGTNPDEIYQQLDTARSHITKSWQALYTAFHSSNSDDANSNAESVTRGNPLSEQEQIRIAYLNMITDSFGNVLANLHQDSTTGNNNQVNVDVLADCLQSGYDLLSQFNSSASSTWYENDFVWNDDPDDDDDNDGMPDEDHDETDDKVVTPHERHRQQLGFQQVH